ncbi:MAG: SagB/ThcOx family dehydrogenase [bacterium]|nr:SagB/ThcOx family dehydrogenase [bacterium]
MTDANPQVGPPPPPKMFTGPQGMTVIIVLIIAAVGWILYAYEFQKSPATQEENDTNSAAMEESSEYVPIEKNYIGEEIALPSPQSLGSVSVEQALSQRRSARAYGDASLTQAQLGQMLWAGQGVTDPESGGRTSPSARSLYPINFYVLVRDVEGIDPGLYHYLPETHSIRLLKSEVDLLTGEEQQAQLRVAPAVAVYGAIYAKVQASFPGDSGLKVVHQESGHIGQNLYLEAESLGLGTVVMGGYDADAVKDELDLPEDETVVYLQPFGPKE